MRTFQGIGRKLLALRHAARSGLIWSMGVVSVGLVACLVDQTEFLLPSDARLTPQFQNRRMERNAEMGPWGRPLSELGPDHPAFLSYKVYLGQATAQEREIAELYNSAIDHLDQYFMTQHRELDETDEIGDAIDAVRINRGLHRLLMDLERRDDEIITQYPQLQWRRWYEGPAIPEDAATP